MIGSSAKLEIDINGNNMSAIFFTEHQTLVRLRQSEVVQLEGSAGLTAVIEANTGTW